MNQANLCEQLRIFHKFPYDLCRVKLNHNENLTDLILNQKKEGLFVAILMDENGSRSHAVGINVGKQLIYDCMETNTMVLNQQNLSTCCGDNRVFHKIQVAGELKTKMSKDV